LAGRCLRCSAGPGRYIKAVEAAFGRGFDRPEAEKAVEWLIAAERLAATPMAT